jgi:transposase
VIDTFNKQLDNLRVENKYLREQVRFLSAKLYGASSEKAPFDHPDLFEGLQIAQAMSPDGPEPEAVPTPRKKKPNSRPRIPEHLPVEETVIEPPEVINNPAAWQMIGEERSDRIAMDPARVYVKRITRRKYISTLIPLDEPNPPIIADLPKTLLPQCILDVSLIAQILIGKFCDHLPLDRQSKIFENRFGVTISQQTMGNAVTKTSELLAPIVEVMARQQFHHDYLQIDETPIKYLEPGKGSSAQGYLWVVHQPGGHTVYHWKTGRSAACLNEIIPGTFQGTIQCDAYKAYESYQRARGNDEIDLAGCFAHVRRKFFDAHHIGLDKVFNEEILSLIRKIYYIEKELREANAPPERRREIRQSESKPITESLEKALRQRETEKGYLPQSKTGKAVSYALNQWDRLQKYLEDGRIEIDNNLVENKIRPTKLGAKNWLFFGSAEAGHRSAVFFSLITSCKNFGIEPSAYLQDVMVRILAGESPESLTPAAWALSQ